jgi:hypothetical protein
LHQRVVNQVDFGLGGGINGDHGVRPFLAVSMN